MNPWPVFWDKVREEVKRLEPLLRDRAKVDTPSEREANLPTDGPKPA